MNYLLDFIESTYNLLINSWGLTVALAGFIAQKFFVPQILEYREILKRARYDLTYYANVFPVEHDNSIFNMSELDDAHKELRVVASKIRSYRDNILFYKIISKIKLVPSYEDTEIAATNLIGWSNDIYETDPRNHARQDRRKKIATALSMRNY